MTATFTPGPRFKLSSPCFSEVIRNQLWIHCWMRQDAATKKHERFDDYNLDKWKCEMKFETVFLAIVIPLSFFQRESTTRSRFAFFSDINYFSSDEFFGVHSISALDRSSHDPVPSSSLRSRERWSQFSFVTRFLVLSVNDLHARLSGNKLKTSAMSMGCLGRDSTKCLASYCYSISCLDRFFGHKIHMRPAIAIRLQLWCK